jgi:hypothetical protein
MKTNETSKEGKIKQSEYTETQWINYEKSLQNDDVVFYMGHSRYGTGPDFGPLDPYSLDAVSRVASKNNLKRMKNALALRKGNPKILGMLTCQSKLYYAKELHDIAGDSGLIMTNQTTSADDMVPIALSSLDSLLGMKCKSSFDKGLNESTRTIFNSKLNSNTEQQKLPQITGFFEKHDLYDDPPVLSPYIFIDEVSAPRPHSFNNGTDKNINHLFKD